MLQKHARVITAGFEADELDHCETAPEAYAHVAPVLRQLATSLGTDTAALRIYDPYYCNGAVAPTDDQTSNRSLR